MAVRGHCARFGRFEYIIPSRLQINPGAAGGALYLERALASIANQAISTPLECEIVVGLDPQTQPPEGYKKVRWAHARQSGQAGAVNAAVGAARGDLLAFLEDDDYWEPLRLAYGLAWLERVDMVTSNQREIGEDGHLIRVNDFATPSGWLLRRAAWERVGPFDETIRFHVDTDYLGRVYQAGLKRVHLVEAGAGNRSWLKNIAAFSEIARTKEPEPLVVRTVNTQGGMYRITHDPEAEAISRAENQRFAEKFGWSPW